MNRILFATRPSALARWQTQWVINALLQAHPGLECSQQAIITQGDVILDKALPEIGGKGLFTQELEAELISGRVQAAVHSLKDLPVENPGVLMIGAVPERGEVRDALVSGKGFTLDTLPERARVGTSSLRRASQLLSARPDLRCDSLRGNVDTRVRKALEGQYDAILLAGAGLTRLGLDKYITEWLPLEIMLPAPGQGAMAVQCRAGDAQTLEILAAIDHQPTRRAVTAERAFLQGLGGGCSLPVAAHAYVEGSSQKINLAGVVASPDGRQIIRLEGEGEDPLELGQRLAQDAKAQGAAEMLNLPVRNRK